MLTRGSFARVPAAAQVPEGARPGSRLEKTIQLPRAAVRGEDDLMHVSVQVPQGVLDGDVLRILPETIGTAGAAGRSLKARLIRRGAEGARASGHAGARRGRGANGSAAGGDVGGGAAERSSALGWLDLLLLFPILWGLLWHIWVWALCDAPGPAAPRDAQRGEGGGHGAGTGASAGNPLADWGLEGVVDDDAGGSGAGAKRPRGGNKKQSRNHVSSRAARARP